MNKGQLRLIAIALKIANDYDYVPDWKEESESIIDEYNFPEAELMCACVSYNGYSCSDLESILLNEVLEYTKPIEQ